MSNYDIREAMAILTKACSDRDREGRTKAYVELTEVVRGLVNKAGRGLRATDTNDGLLILRGNTSILSLSFDESGVVAANGSAPTEQLQIEYDGERFVGTEEDTFMHSTPGAPRARRAATAVIAERIARALAEKYPR